MPRYRKPPDWDWVTKPFAESLFRPLYGMEVRCVYCRDQETRCTVCWNHEWQFDLRWKNYVFHRDALRAEGWMAA